ncbi:MAG: FAD-binding oxidoreductase, partial [Longispora sp.]|nr:FAD-binding oxidoreductase [Longispora sp. (in: high G+C Gram-positive bacteria)]
MPSTNASMRWGGWGDPDRATHLPESLKALLGTALGVKEAGTPIPDPEGISLAAPSIPGTILTALAEVCDCSTSTMDRLAHTRGKSTPDLLRI